MPADDFNARVSATMLVYRESCREHHDRVSGDGAVSEKTAARLIGVSTRTLARRYAEGRPMPRFSMCDDLHRRYRLGDLAAWTERGYDRDERTGNIENFGAV